MHITTGIPRLQVRASACLSTCFSTLHIKMINSLPFSIYWFHKHIQLGRWRRQNMVRAYTINTYIYIFGFRRTVFLPMIGSAYRLVNTCIHPMVPVSSMSTTAVKIFLKRKGSFKIRTLQRSPIKMNEIPPNKRYMK